MVGIVIIVMKCWFGMGFFRGVIVKIDIWLFLLGFDFVVKVVIVKVLVEMVFGGERSFLYIGFVDGLFVRLEGDDSGMWY